MASISIRLDDSDQQMLEQLVSEFGSKAGAIRHALRILAADRRRRDALDALMDSWNDEAGPLDEDEVSDISRRYGL